MSGTVDLQASVTQRRAIAVLDRPCRFPYLLPEAATGLLSLAPWTSIFSNDLQDLDTWLHARKTRDSGQIGHYLDMARSDPTVRSPATALFYQSAGSPRPPQNDSDLSTLVLSANAMDVLACEACVYEVLS